MTGQEFEERMRIWAAADREKTRLFNIEYRRRKALGLFPRRIRGGWAFWALDPKEGRCRWRNVLCDAAGWDYLEAWRFLCWQIEDEQAALNESRKGKIVRLDVSNTFSTAAI